MNRTFRKVLIATAVTIVGSSVLWATAGSGTSSALVGSAVYDGFKVKRNAHDDWRLEIEAKDGVKVATQTITFQPGGQSGWHTHPGIVFISVKEGTMTFYDESCNATVIGAGGGFLDSGDHAHLARNETGLPATNVVTYLVPPNAAALRFDAPQPPNCGV